MSNVLSEWSNAIANPRIGYAQAYTTLALNQFWRKRGSSEVESDSSESADQSPTVEVGSLYTKVRYLNEMLNSLWLLPLEEADEDSVAATQWAISRTSSLLVDACKQFVAASWGQGVIEFPNGFLFADDGGGIRIEWGMPGANSVRLSIAANKDKLSYLYTEIAGRSNLIKVPEARDLALALKNL